MCIFQIVCSLNTHFVSEVQYKNYEAERITEFQVLKVPWKLLDQVVFSLLFIFYQTLCQKNCVLTSLKKKSAFSNNVIDKLFGILLYLPLIVNFKTTKISGGSFGVSFLYYYFLCITALQHVENRFKPGQAAWKFKRMMEKTFFRGLE